MPTRAKDWSAHVLVLLVLLMSVVMLQAWSGAYVSELSDPDEPAHFISGLLVRDYVAGFFPGSPIAYARDYYAHYPKVAIGNWPPLFHATQGIWLLISPANPASVLVLMALITATTAWLIYLVLLRSLDRTHALFAAGLFMVMRPVPAFASAVMIEMMLVLTTTIAAWLFAVYLDGLRLRQGLAFGAACVIAVLTKGNALLLGLLPPFAVLIGGRWSVLGRRGVWLAALLVLIIAGPWTVYFLSTAQAGWLEALPSAAFIVEAGVYYVRGPLRALGPVCLILALAGVWTRVVHPGARRAVDATLWVCAAALGLSVITFHMLVPAGTELRHLIPAYPALAMFAAAGAHRCSTELRRRGMGQHVAAAVVIGVASVAFFAQAFRLQLKQYDGYAAAAAAVLDHASGSAATSMIISTATGEGAFISEVAVRDDNRPSHIVWRGTNLLASATWAGRDYRLRAQDEAGVIALIEQAAVRFIVIDRTTIRFRHQAQIESTIANHPQRFSQIAELPLHKETGYYPAALVVYELLPAGGWTPYLPPRVRQIPGYEGLEPLE